jgi:hypothetical protein
MNARAWWRWASYLSPKFSRMPRNKSTDVQEYGCEYTYIYFRLSLSTVFIKS